MWPLGLLKNGKNRHVKYMFFANIFVIIEHRQMIIENNIVRLIMIHKSNSIHFLSKRHSFRVFGCQSWQKLHIVFFKWRLQRTVERYLVNMDTVRRFFCKFYNSVVPHMLKSQNQKRKRRLENIYFFWLTNSFWKINYFLFWRWVGGLEVVGRWVGVFTSGGWVGLVRWGVGWAWSNWGNRWDGV